MGARNVIGKENIETARQLLIADAVGYIEDERFAKKAAVRDLIGTLIAARTRGLSFERMAQLLETAGVPITAGTLRAYFFELKTEKELQEENRKHAEKLARVRDKLRAKELAENLKHAQEVAIEHVAKRSLHRPRLNVFVNTMLHPMEFVQPVPVIPAQPSLSKQTAPLARKNRVPRFEDPIATSVAVSVFAAASVKPELHPQATAIDTSVTPAESPPAAIEVDLNAVQARTIDEIAMASVGMEVGELVENLHVRERGEVWCESGKPYTGFLKAKQVYLLRIVGKLIAPTVGRSSGDFVEMSRDL